MPLVIAQPGPADARRLAEIHVATWQHAYAGLIPEPVLAALTPEWRLPMWQNVLTRQPGRALGAWVDGELVGFALFGPSRAHEAHERLGELFALYVLPTHWDAGVGRALGLGAVSALAADHDAAVLWVATGNTRAIRFYERAGWVADGGRERDEALPGVHIEELRYRRALR